MRPSLLRLASAANTQRGLKPNPTALLPPIPLYRRLLRAHRKHLPAEMRVLGDEYIKAEFRAHRKVDNPAHLVCFLQKIQHEHHANQVQDWFPNRVANVCAKN